MSTPSGLRRPFDRDTFDTRRRGRTRKPFVCVPHRHRRFPRRAQGRGCQPAGPPTGRAAGCCDVARRGCDGLALEQRLDVDCRRDRAVGSTRLDFDGQHARHHRPHNETGSRTREDRFFVVGMQNYIDVSFRVGFGCDLTSGGVPESSAPTYRTANKPLAISVVRR